MNDHLSDYTDDERRLFRDLPRTSMPDPAIESAIVTQLRGEGLLRSPRQRLLPFAYAALAAALVVAAWFGGARHGALAAHGSSIEGLVARNDLSSADRILLMQRAGSAYVAAANGYASSVKTADSGAVEVSSRVLLSAAQAVARTDLGGALAPRIASMFRDMPSRDPALHPAVIWY